MYFLKLKGLRIITVYSFTGNVISARRCTLNNHLNCLHTHCIMVNELFNKLPKKDMAQGDGRGVGC